MNSNNSLNNVKRIFETKTGVNLKVKRPVRRAVKTTVALIAAIICCLTMSAFAINFFSDNAMATFFQRGAIPFGESNNELSESQLLATENYTTYINQSMESQGIILTVKSVTASISSGNLVAYFVIEMEAPHGVLDNIHNFDLIFEESRLLFERSSENTMSSGSGGSIDVVLDDAQGRDNVKTIVYSYGGTNLDFINKETSFKLIFKNLCRWQEPDRENTHEKLTVNDFRRVVVEGEWSFDFDFGIFKESIDLIQSSVLFSEYGYTLTTLQISPLCLYLSLDYSELKYIDDQIEAPLAFCNDIQIIMDDGTLIQLIGDGPVQNSADSGSNSMTLGGATMGEARLITSYYFNTPIDLEEADHILFADGTHIDIQ